MTEFYLMVTLVTLVTLVIVLVLIVSGFKSITLKFGSWVKLSAKK